MKRHGFALTILGFLLIIAIIVLYFYVIQNKSAFAPKLVLSNLPANYCPSKVEVAIENTTSKISDKDMDISNCDNIAISSILPTANGQYTLKVKLPQALAFKMNFSVPLNADLQYFIQLGDANSDNIIDGQDLTLINEYMFLKTDKETAVIKKIDLDNDGIIGVSDYSIASQNQGVGVLKIDNSAWSDEVK